MKFTWFHLMPWPHMPEDFRQKHRSVWVDLPSRMYEPELGHIAYHQYLDQLEYAEKVGFDGIGVNEHHANAYGLMPSPNIMAATLTRRTSRSALVVLGNSIALYNPPLRVAEEFAMLDVLSGGRLIAGFPVGTSMDTNYAYGTVPALTREKYAEAHDLIKKAWTADEPFAFNGRYTKLRYVNCWPKPVQRPLPVFIPGGGSVETYDFCIDNTYSYSYLSYSGYLRAKLLMEGYWKRIAERKVDESPYRAGFAQVICVADTDEEAERLYWPHVSYFYNRCLHVYPGFADAPGYRTIKTIQSETGLMVDKFIILDFNAVKKVVDVLGGVRVCLTTPVYDPYVPGRGGSGLNLPAGYSTIKGKQALAFVRARESIGDGSDLGRIQRQQEFLSSMIRGIEEKGILTSPTTLYRILGAITSSITPSFKRSRLVSFRDRAACSA